MALYQGIKFHLITCTLNTFRDMLQTSLSLQKLGREKTFITTGDRVIVLACCTFSDGPLSMYQISFNSLAHFHRYGPDKFFIASITKSSAERGNIRPWGFLVLMEILSTVLKL